MTASEIRNRELDADAARRELVRFEADGMRWVAEGWLDQPLRERLVPNLATPEAVGAEQVKRSLSRSVYRMELGGRSVYVKLHKVRSWKEWLKYLVLPSRAAVEWEVSRALAERGIPAARAVAFGERRIFGVLAEAVLVSEAVEACVPFGEARRRDPGLLSRAARLVRKAHDAGVHHRDLHGGNILVAGTELVFVDLHRVRVHGTASQRERVAGVAHFLAALGGGVGEDERFSFVREYLGDSASEAERARFARSVERLVKHLRERRYASRTKRCTKKSTGFRRERVGGMTVRRRANFPKELVLAAIERHKEQTAVGGSSVLKCDGRTRVTRVALVAEGCPPSLCVKEFIRAGLLRRIGDAVVGSPARRAWVGANACVVRGIPTPNPLAMVDAGERSFFIAEYVENAQEVVEYISDFGRPRGREATAAWRKFLHELARFIRTVHSHRLRHRDLSGKNILVREHDGRSEFFLVDVGDIRPGQKPSLRFKIKNLGQLDDVYVPPSRTDRLRFYRAYAAGRPEFDRREFLLRIDRMSRARRAHSLRHGGAKILEERRRQGKPV